MIDRMDMKLPQVAAASIAVCMALCSCGDRPRYQDDTIKPEVKIEAPPVPPAIEFKGIVLGEKGAQNLLDLLASDPDCKRKIKSGKGGDCSPSVTYGGRYHKRVRLVVEDGALYSATVYNNPQIFDELYRDLMSKYGPPSWEERTPMQNAFGVQVLNEKYMWKAANGSTLHVFKYLGEITTGAVQLRSKKAVDDEEEHLRSFRAKSGKNDL